MTDPELILRDGSRELVEQVRARIVAPGGLFFFGKFVCQFKDIDYRAHGPLCLCLEWFDEQTHDVRTLLIEYPRKSLKTTIATVTYTLWHFACLAIRNQPTDWRVAIRSSTQSNSSRMLRILKSVVETNVYFQSFVPELVPEFGNEDVWNTEEIIFPGRSRAMGEPSVDALGVGSKATSRHYDHICEDDFINEENWDSPTAIAKAIDAHRLGESLLESGRSTRIVNENSWTQFDLNNHIIKNEPSTAIFSVDAEEGLNESRARLLPPQVRVMCDQWHDGKAVWEARFDLTELARIREVSGPRIYNAQYKNKPFDPEVVDFRTEWLRHYEWGKAVSPNGVERRILRISDGEGAPVERIELRDLMLIGALDPAMGSKTDVNRDGHGSLTSFHILGVDPLDRGFVLESIGHRKDPYDCMEEVLTTAVRWGLSEIWLEDVLFQRLIQPLADLYIYRARSEAARRGDWAHWSNRVSSGIFRGVKPLRGKDKDGRIRYFLTPPAKEGRLYAHRSQLLLHDEWDHFPLSEHKDMLDSLAYCVQHWRRGESDEERTGRLQKELEVLQAPRDPFTGY